MDMESYADNATETTHLIHVLEERMQHLIEKGDLKEARNAANTAVARARSVAESDQTQEIELAKALELRADFLRTTGDLDESERDYDEALTLLEQKTGVEREQGKVCAGLAVVHELNESLHEARTYYERAIGCFSVMNPVARLDIADMKNNLAFIYEADGDYDTAETLLLESLRITHEDLGLNTEEAGTICNNLGGLYFKSGVLEQAREMHSMALDARIEVLGKDDPDTAQSHANLALVQASLGDHAMAMNSFREALRIYEGRLGTNARDYQTVAANFTDYLRNHGSEKEAAALEKRSLKNLRKA